MLNFSDRFYFIHIPKTAGTTLIPLLDARFDANDICPAQLWRELVTLPQESLPQYRFFRGHFGAGGLQPFLPEPPLYLTMLRHPLSLTLSTYRFILRESGTRVHHLVKERAMSFSDFLDSPETRKKVSDMQVRHLSFDLRHDPDTGPIFLSAESRSAVDKWVLEHEVSLSAEQRLERAKRMLHACAWLGLAERFDESMALLSWTFGWPPVGQVQKLRVAPGGSNSDDLPEEVREKVLNCNKLDMALYQEAERLFQDRVADMLGDLMRYARPGEVVPGTFAKNPALVNQLLDRHYRHHLEARPLAQESLYLSLQEPLLGSGWHRRERAPADNSTFRWSGPGTESFIDLPIQGGQEWMLEFRIVHALALDILGSLQVTAHGVPLELEITEGTRETTVRRYRCLLPVNIIADKSRGLVRLVFKVNRTLSPQSLDPANPDERQVGIALNWLRAERLEGIQGCMTTP
ncbi:sulfotransferase family 2 domain-containing protein, partial [Nitrosococcus watsonii]|uniref:Sulfotransferase family protein n=1 Tax=Nitrosococcus watsoni (strain C-113) TaxID=105559 RepID=D8K946_NITWC